MPNNWFQFKQFRIEQDSCAMKVGTDSVILGAWTRTENAGVALDVGTGTGLLALMLAQKSNSLKIDAIEIDEQAALQARENVERSRFRERIRIFNISFQEFSAFDRRGCYDLIISNPPYFSDSKEGLITGRNLARHNYHLSMDQIIKGACMMLSDRGRLNIVLPASERSRLDPLLKANGLFMNRLLEIIPAPGKNAARICCEISAHSSELSSEQMMVETGKRHQYSSEYKSLTSPFYL